MLWLLRKCVVNRWRIDLQDASDRIFVFQVAVWANDGDAVFIREFTLIRRDHLPEEPLHDVSQKPEDPVSAWPGNTALIGELHLCAF